MDSGDSSPSPAHVLDVCCFLALSRSSTISGWFSRIAQSSAVSPAYVIVRVCVERVGGWGAGGEEGAGVGEVWVLGRGWGGVHVEGGRGGVRGGWEQVGWVWGAAREVWGYGCWGGEGNPVAHPVPDAQVGARLDQRLGAGRLL